MTVADIDAVVTAFAEAAGRALAAGFELVEIHGAHGYLLHEFLSPLTNQRTDEYGGSFENRIRFLERVIAAVRGVWPERLPLLLRISATDWACRRLGFGAVVRARHSVEGRGDFAGRCLERRSGVARQSAGGPWLSDPVRGRDRRRTGMLTGAVGMIVRARAGRSHRAERPGRSGLAGARDATRSLFPRRAARALG